MSAPDANTAVWELPLASFMSLHTLDSSRIQHSRLSFVQEADTPVYLDRGSPLKDFRYLARHRNRQLLLYNLRVFIRY
jgi:hypothetical protein